MGTVASDDIRILERSVERFAREQIAPHLDALNHYPDQPLPGALIDDMRALGLFDLGGEIEALSDVLRTLSETAAAPAALVFAHSFAAQLLLESGATVAGTLLAYPVYAEFAAPSTQLTCRAAGKGVVLNGVCEMVVNAPVADLLVLPATVDDGEEISLVAVRTQTPGLQVGDPLLTLGMRGCPVADVTANDVRIESELQIATHPQAAAHCCAVARRLRGPAVAISAGVLASSLRTATDYARERYQGGCYIIEHEQVRAMIAEMLADYALCRDVAQRLSTGEAREPAAASSFIRAKQRAARATCDGVQLLGGYGYMEDYGQERCMRDAKQAEFLLGRCDALRQELVDGWLDGGAHL